ncbi:MAG: LytTR family DNA-binding domain-containing protein [Eubacteriales bacterium]|nr:LytTR family DNA-binding domain-containing protein [Eubacteriales bacterium]
MKIAICEDEVFWQEQLEEMVRRWAKEKREPLCLRSFPDSESFLFAFSEEKDWDVLLLDIEMGKKSGMELAEKVRRENEEVGIIFATGYAEYMGRGYDVGALQYLLKPVEEKKLFACLDKMLRRQEREGKKLAFETTDQRKLSLSAADIWYLEAFRHRCLLYTKDQSYELKMSMTEAERILGEEAGFIKCHRSYLLNLRRVREIYREELVLDDGRKVPASRRAWQKVNAAFLRFYSDCGPVS